MCSPASTIDHPASSGSHAEPDESPDATPASPLACGGVALEDGAECGWLWVAVGRGLALAGAAGSPAPAPGPLAWSGGLHRHVEATHWPTIPSCRQAGTHSPSTQPVVALGCGSAGGLAACAGAGLAGTVVELGGGSRWAVALGGSAASVGCGSCSPSSPHDHTKTSGSEATIGARR